MTCPTGKHQHATAAAAMVEARKFHGHVYRCAWCGAHHASHWTDHHPPKPPQPYRRERVNLEASLD